MHKKDHALKICPRCHRKFHCCESEGCWCEKLLISRHVLAFLRKKYVNCICKECLDNMAAICKN